MYTNIYINECLDGIIGTCDKLLMNYFYTELKHSKYV